MLNIFRHAFQLTSARLSNIFLGRPPPVLHRAGRLIQVMDIDRFNFPSQILGILDAISRAHFVSFDLELSGVASRSAVPATGKPTLQQKYQEVKEAAERYRILQFGLTCVEEDHENGRYIARPYNFHLNPCLEERLDVERIFSFQSGAVDFLLSHNFQMEVPFTKGVPYLSRAEAAVARERELLRLNKEALADVVLKSTDIQALDFVHRTRQKLDEWRTTGYPQGFLNIGPALATPLSQGELSRFEKRLVHQLVRANYPDVVANSKRGFVQCIPHNQAKEDAHKTEQIKRMEEKLVRQIGFRWLVEALTGGDLSSINARYLIRGLQSETTPSELQKIETRFTKVRKRLAHRKTVLVGHNLLTDVVNLYHCFIGILPDSVEDFSRTINDLFPMVIDTKYMATHNCGDLNPASSLEQTGAQLDQQLIPEILTDYDHHKYLVGQSFHEAGFDSFLTAKICARLSAKLEAEGTYLDEDSVSSSDSEYATPPEEEDGGVSIFASRLAKFGISSHSEKPPPDQRRPSNKASKKTREKDVKPAQQSRYASANIFESLQAQPDEAQDSLQDSDAEPRNSKSSSGRPTESKRVKGLATNGRSGRADLMPPWHSTFWKVYGNKLRVFGTAEGVCELHGNGRQRQCEDLRQGGEE